MQWGKRELVVAANRTRVVVTIIPAELNKEVDFSGMSQEEKEKAIAQATEELKKEFVTQFLEIAKPYIRGPKPTPKPALKKVTEEKPKPKKIPVGVTEGGEKP